MNKVFKIIYNFSIQQFVVVSELSKSKGKSSGKIDKRIKPEALLSLSVAGGLFLGSNVFAANLVTPNQFYAETDNTNSFVAIGETAKKQSEGGGVVIGTNASVNRKNAVAIGQNVSVGMQSTDGGWQLLGSETTAIGSNVTAGMNNSVVMGSNILVGVPDFPSGTTIGHIVESVAIGSKLNTPTGHVTMMGSNITAPGQYSIGIGNNIFIKETSVQGDRTNSILMGFGLNSTAAKTFSVGSNIQASGSDMVSMGADIVNNAPTRGIAIGDKVNITTTSSYVVAIGSATKAFGGGAIAVGREAIARDTSKNLIVMGTSATAGGGEGAMALGDSANATAKGAMALGRKSIANGANTIAIGSESSVTGLNSVALGSGISVDTAGSVVLGNASSSTVAETVSDANVGSYTYSADRFAGKDFSNRAGSYVSVGSATNPRQIKFVGAGKIDKTSTDAINGSQLYAVMERAETGWSITTSKSGNGDVSGTIDDNIGLAEILTVDASNNINITQSANKISIATSTKPTFETVNVTNRLNVGDIVVDASGINMANKPITNLKAGEADTDAVNVSQLKQASSAVRAGTNTYVGTAANATSGGTDYIVHAFNTTVSNGSAEVKVTPTFDSTTNTTNYAIDLSDSAKSNITTANEIANAANNTANAGWKLNTTSSGNGQVSGSTDETINMNETVTLDAGNNINITQAQNKITIATSTKPTFETVNVTNSLNVGDIVVDKDSGINMDSKPITNLQAGVADTDAVNVSQLKQARSAVVAGSNTVVATQANATSGGTDYIVHTFNTTATGSDQIKVTPTFDSTTNTTNYAIDLSDSAKTNITTANEIANAANNTANAGWKLNTTSSGNGQVSGSSDETINMNETVTLDAGNNINITQAQNKITIATSTKPTFETVNVTNSLNVGDIVVDKDSGINMDSKPITNLQAGVADTDAVNVSQLKQASSAVRAGTNTYVGTAANATSGGTDYIVHAFNTTVSNGSAEVKVTPTFDSTTNTTNYAIDLSDSAKSNITTANEIANAANNTANAGWKLNTTSSGNGQVSGSSDETINMNETVTLDAGNNINITQAQNKITIATSTKPTFETVNVTNSLNVGDIVVDANGINMANKPITNLQAGVADTDAVNVSQLKQARSAVVAGSNTVVATQANATSGGTDYIVHTFNTTVSNGSAEVKVTPTFDSTTNTTNYAIDLSDSAKSNITTANDIANAANNTANAGWKLNTTSSGNGQVSGSTDETINMNETVTLDAGNNINITQATNKITIATSTKPTFETVNVTNSLNVGDIVVDKDSGINMANKPITNLKAGEADTDAVNVSQLKNASSNMIATGLNFAGDNNVTVHRDLGQTLKIEGGATSNLTYGNIGVVEDPANGSLSVRLAEKLNLGSNGTITMGNTTLADNQIKVGEQTRIGNGTATIGDITIADGKLTGLKDGKISADSTEAINGSQLYNVVNNISNVAGDVAKGWNLNTSASGGFVENSSLEQIKMGETVTIDAGKNVNITQAGNTVSIAVSNNPTFENVTTDNLIFAGNPNATLSYAGDGFNLNGNKLTNVANGTNATDAVNVQQLNNAGWTVAGNGSSVSKVVNNNVVSFDNGSGTTARVAKNNDGSTSVSYDVNRSPIITNSEGKLVAGNKSGFATADDIANAINQSGWKVQSTATAGTTGKVVNLDSNGNQMARQSATKVSVGNTVNINAGNNVVVTRQGRNIEVATSMTPTFNTVSVGNGEVTIGASKDTDGVSQVTLAGKDGKSAVRVTNIATGKADTDAVNVGQLRNTARALTNNINAVNDRVTKVDRRLRAGVAGALAVGNLPQVHTNGKSQLAAGVGSYRGQNALAVGYSRLSDNGKVILKVSGNADTRGDVGGAASIGFEW